MQRVTRDHIQYVFDRHPAPVLRVNPGEVFEVETEDARTGKTRTPETTTPEYVKSLRSKGQYYGNPVTGPLWIEGASPGDVLAVHLHAIDCDTLGFFGYWPFVYHLQDWLKEPFTGLVDIRDGFVSYTMQTRSGPHRVRVPISPMAGCIGTAPELEVPTTSSAGRFGGNLDVPEVCAGSIIYLPVAVAGGYLYIGDCHPYQGDGELAGCEMRSLIRMSVEVRRPWRAMQNCVRIETPTHLVTVGVGSPAEYAQWQAIRDMIVWLEERYGWTTDEARTLLALTGDVRPGQMLVVPYTMRLCVAKEHLPAKASGAA